MKRMIALTAAVLLLLTGCGSQKTEKTVDPKTVTDTYLTSQAFTDTLEEVSSDIAVTLLGLDEADVTDIKCYMSGGATAEELTVVTAKDADAAGRVSEALTQHVEDQKTAMKDYLPGEVDKLDHAVQRTFGNVVVLMVAADWDYASGVDDLAK